MLSLLISLCKDRLQNFIGLMQNRDISLPSHILKEICDFDIMTPPFVSCLALCQLVRQSLVPKSHSCQNKIILMPLCQRLTDFGISNSHCLSFFPILSYATLRYSRLMCTGWDKTSYILGYFYNKAKKKKKKTTKKKKPTFERATFSSHFSANL